MRGLKIRLILLILFALLYTTIVRLTSQTVAAFKVGVHEDVTRQALKFLKKDILDDIVDEHKWLDIYGAPIGTWDPSWHFDDCRFKETTERINRQYDKVLDKLNPNKPDDPNATDEFGQLLHPVQDFYSHSNWVDMGRGDLIDTGLGRWTVLTPWSNVRGVIVIQGKNPPAGWMLKRDGRIVTVTIPDRGDFRGLISGTWGLTHDCPNNIAMSHGDLNKDDATRANFQAAWDLALKQTRHEWCRLESLVLDRYGKSGLDRLREEWIIKGEASPCLGSSQQPSVPTLTEWGLLALGLLLAGSLAFMIRRRYAPRPAGA